MKEHKSWQKDKVIKGMVIDNPRSVHWEYAEGTFFLMELGQDVTAKFGKKLDDVTLDQGETVVIGGVVRCYIRKNDQIELKGQVVKLVHDDRARGESIYIRADKVYNETLKFSLDY